MTLHKVRGPNRCSRRAGSGWGLSSLRVLVALGSVGVLAAGCATPDATRAPTGSPAATPGESPAGHIVGAPGEDPSYTAAPITPLRVDFEVNGDENNGWWWLRDGAGLQKASWGFFGVPAASEVELDLTLLATDTVAGKPGVDARFWLTYGAIVEGNVANTPDNDAVLVTLSNAPSDEGSLDYTASGTYTISSADLPTGSLGVWVRIARAGPDGTVLPEHLAVTESSVRIADLGGPNSTPPPVGTPPNIDFEVVGDEISGWWWLRDAAGSQRASWAFFGTPVADQVRLDINLLATDRVSGPPFVDAQFWLTYGPILDGGNGPALADPILATLKNSSPENDPLGYATSGFFTITRSDIPSGAIGIWVGITRRGPDGTVLPTHIAVQAASMQASGLAGPTETAGPDQTPAPSPTSSALYGPLTLTTFCQAGGTSPAMIVSGSAAPDLHIEFSPDESFTSVYANEGFFVLSPPAYTYESLYSPATFPNGIWVRWTEAPSIKAHATNKGYCAGSTPPPTPSPAPTPTPGPPSGTPTIVALGDSYISGEAGRWAGNTSDWYYLVDGGGSTAYYDNASGNGEAIAGCHRSKSAEVHIDRGGYGTVTTINLACSGATTQTRNPGDGIKPGVDNCPTDIHRTDCPSGVIGQATMLAAEARVHNVKMVVLSIGGNDFEFSGTVAQCAKDFASSSYVWKDYCNDDGSVKARFTDDNVAKVKAKLVNAYEDIMLAMKSANYADSDWSLLIQNYPSPLPPGGDIRYIQPGWSRFNNGCPFWNADADWANDTALPRISSTINSAVAAFSVKYPGVDVHVMDVSQALIGHRLCEDTVNLVGPDKPVKYWGNAGASNGSEWVAQIRGILSSGGLLPLPGLVYYKNESFHPNYWGQLALRNCLRQAYNNGDVRGGKCEFMQEGLGSFGEPRMILTQP
jgi:hypothetical protein